MTNTPLQDIQELQTDVGIFDAWLHDDGTTNVDFSAAQDGSDMRPSLSKFLDGIAEPLPFAGGPARVALAAALPAWTYANGALGVGATITANANGAIPNIDGQAPALNDRVWVWDWTGAGGTNIAYGLYAITQLGDGTHPWIMTRAVDANSAAELGAGSAYVRAGAVNAGLSIQITLAASSITLGTTPIGAVVVNGNTAVGAETARATAAEAAIVVTLDAAITVETARAEAAEAGLAISVTAEATRALAAEAALAGDFAPLSAALATIETLLTSAIFNTARFCIGGTPPGTVDAATTAALPNCIYDPEVGSGDQLIGVGGFAALPAQDGVAMTVGKRLGVKNQVAALQNGLYTLTQQGDGATVPWVLTRSADAWQAAQLGGIEYAVNGGTLNAGTVWLLPVAPASIVVGITALNFVALSTAGNLVVTGPDRWDSVASGAAALNAASRCIAADPTAGAVNLTLPATHQNISVKDKTRTASVATPINVSPDAGSTIEGGAGPFVIAVAGAGFVFKFDTQNNDWSVFG